VADANELFDTLFNSRLPPLELSDPTGKSVISISEKGPPLLSCFYIDVSGKPGAVGPARKALPAPVPVAVDGKDGILTKAAITYTQFAERIDALYFKMQLREAESNYLNARYLLAGQQLIWLRELAVAATKRFEGGGSIEGMDAADAVVAGNRSAALLRQLQLGLDYYGRPAGYVPLLSFSYYNTQFKQVIENCEKIEQTYLDYRQASNDINKVRTSTAVAISQAGLTAQAIRLNIEALQKQILDLDNQIELLKIELDKIWVELYAADQAFKSAVAKQRAACTFGKVVAFVVAAAAVAQGGGAAATGIIGAVQNLGVEHPTDADGKPITGDFARVKYYLAPFGQVAKNAQEFLDAFNNLQNVIAPQGTETPTIPNDQAKLLVDRDAFDKEIEPYLGLPEAQRYKELMHRFLDVAGSRNQKIVEYNSLYAVLYGSMARLEALEKSVADVQSALARSVNPAVPIYALFFEDGLRRARDLAVYLLYQGSAALNYLSGTNDQVEIRDLNSAALRVASNELLRKLTTYKEQSQIPEQKLTNVALRLEKIVSARALDECRKTGVLTFTLRQDSEEVRQFINGLSLLRVSRLVVEAPELLSQGKRFNVQVFHHGNSELRDIYGRRQQYSHLPIVAINVFDGSGNANAFAELRDTTKDYVGVSLLGSWTIRFLFPKNADGSPSINLSAIKSLRFRFDAGYTPTRT
jgi:hypothetical protein